MVSLTEHESKFTTALYNNISFTISENIIPMRLLYVHSDRENKCQDIDFLCVYVSNSYNIFSTVGTK